MTPRRALLVLLLPVLLLPAVGRAQLRTIPEEARRGFVQHVQQMVVTVDGNRTQLAPGAVVRDRNNFIIVPTAMPREGAWADYTLDQDRQIFRVWLLTPEELAKPKRQADRQ